MPKGQILEKVYEKQKRKNEEQTTLTETKYYSNLQKAHRKEGQFMWCHVFQNPNRPLI